jgi:hypothetical protein
MTTASIVRPEEVATISAMSNSASVAIRYQRVEVIEGSDFPLEDLPGRDVKLPQAYARSAIR